MNARIRPATNTDAPALATLITEVGYPASIEGVLRLLAHRDAARSSTIVADVEGVVAGLLAVCCRPSLVLQGWVGTISELVVKPAHRRAEIGEALLHYAKGLAVERGLARLECVVPEVHHPVGGGFLLERGFEVADARTYRWAVLESKHPRLPAPARGRRLLPA